jgi:hypothetical protein
MKDNIIRISGIDYAIKFKPPEEMGGLIGSANFNAQEICINTSCSIPTQQIAILHEILHILSDSYNLKMDEEAVKFTTHALLAILLDNPHLLPDLLGIFYNGNTGQSQ